MKIVARAITWQKKQFSTATGTRDQCQRLQNLKMQEVELVNEGEGGNLHARPVFRFHFAFF